MNWAYFFQLLSFYVFLTSFFIHKSDWMKHSCTTFKNNEKFVSVLRFLITGDQEKSIMFSIFIDLFSISHIFSMVAKKLQYAILAL